MAGEGALPRPRRAHDAPRPGGPRPARAKTFHGLVLTLAGRPEEAVTYLRPALDVLAERLPPGDPLTAQTEGALALALAAQGRLAEARPLLEESQAAFRARFGPDHPQTREAARQLESLAAR